MFSLNIKFETFNVKWMSHVTGWDTFINSFMFLCGLFYDGLSNTDHISPDVGMTRD
jgi:hypothetical protein